MANNDIPSVYVEDDQGDEIEVKLPWSWAICYDCHGDGTHALHGIAITSDEWWGPDWTDESREMYMTGGYDTPCEECGGSGKVREVDEAHCDPALLALWVESAVADAEDRAMRESERRMGC